MYWFTLGMLAMMVGLCIVGAFLGAGLAKGLFNSPPMCVFWGVLAVLLAGSLFWRSASLWRSPGLSAIHVGVLLILVGGFWGSQARYDWQGRLLSPDHVNPDRGYLLLKPNTRDNNASAELWNFPPDGSLIQAGTLPFTVEARRAWLEYYPPEHSPYAWQLMGIVRDKDSSDNDLTPLFGDVGLPALFPAIRGEVTVLGYNPTLRTVDLELTHNHVASRLTFGPVHQPAMLLLRDLFKTQRDWRNAGQPALALVPPDQAVRDSKADLVLRHTDGNLLTDGVVEVNHPLHAKGYHIYLNSYDPELGLLLQAVRDDGLYCVYAGFALLLLGLVLHIWIKPMIRFFRRRDSLPATAYQEAGDVG